jgi:hypothetical protein
MPAAAATSTNATASTATAAAPTEADPCLCTVRPETEPGRQHCRLLQLDWGQDLRAQVLGAQGCVSDGC